MVVYKLLFLVRWLIRFTQGNEKAGAALHSGSEQTSLYHPPLEQAHGSMSWRLDDPSVRLNLVCESEIEWPACQPWGGLDRWQEPSGQPQGRVHGVHPWKTLHPFVELREFWSTWSQTRALRPSGSREVFIHPRFFSICGGLVCLIDNHLEVQF